MNNNALSEEDITLLLKSSSDEKKSITDKVAKLYSIKGIEDNQKNIAEEIFQLLVKDTEQSIRKILAESVKDIDHIPHSIVSQLAADTSEVAIPVIKYSSVLTDEDLLNIISTDDFEKQKSITYRSTVSGKVSESLLDTGKEEIVSSLLVNKGAEVFESGYNKIFEKFSSNQNILEDLVQREELPVSIVDKMVNSVSDAIRTALKSKYPKEFEKLLSFIDNTKDVAALKAMGATSSNEMLIKFMSFVDKLEISKDLLPIVALCIGNLEIFNILISRMSGIPLKNIKILESDKSNKGLKALYERLPLPSNFCNEVLLLFSILRDNESDFLIESLALSNKQTNLFISYIMEEIQDDKDSYPQIDFVLRIMYKNIEDGLFSS